MYWRRRLPHWVPEDAELLVTWRLAGGRPPHIASPTWLGQPEIAAIVAEALVHGERDRRSYDLLAWAVMPDHVHMVIKPIQQLPEIMRWLKGATANRANELLRKKGTPFWQREYFDRWIRSDEQLASAIEYVEENPVRMGLAACAEEWRWSSAYKAPAAETAGATNDLKPNSS